MNSFLTNKELKKIGFKSVGENCQISRYATFYNTSTIDIGNNVRIDDFCILSGNILLKSYIHISAFSALYGSKGIIIEDFSGLSPRTTLFSAIDDFSGEFMVNPTIPKELTNVTGGQITIKKYVQLGTNTIVMPNITINEGAVTGAFSFVNHNLQEWTINYGIPAAKMKERKKNIIGLSSKVKRIYPKQ